MPVSHAPHLLNPLRAIFLSPGKLARRLKLDRNFHVLEVGPGPGYFSPEIAKAIPDGRLVLADIQPEMLTMARTRLKKRGIRNAEYVHSGADDLPFEDGSFDVVFLVAVLGEVPDRAACLRELRRVLKPECVLSITEQPGDPDRIPLPEMRQLAAAAGFRQCAIYGKGRNYTANFMKQP